MTRRALLITGGALLAAAIALGILVVTVPAGATNALDEFWNGVAAQLREPWVLWGALFMNRVGGGWIAVLLVPLLIVASLVAVRRWRSAVFAASAFIVSAGLTQLLKNLFARARPDDMLVASDFGSFPSGHTANAATIAVVLWLVFPRVWVAVVGVLWVLVMALSRTILAVHWITDTIGGALVGASAALLVAGMLWGWASLGWSGPPAASARSPRAEDPTLP
ncbi:phosphatase PAP2 family protein [Microbacterium esteraromaticum]|uniref:Phosphatase PAP2 family protein n=1 Tax=Microbacterium esteraromaticum TaxID=57043 RepID=A0A939IVQ5_9MICO|nr:phosphatase PAP2 family protein [Microbacterium esteraromaticum]MBN8206691.1 phosphatase PAP2 family protein [Microbacterium esteraromaticum]MBN8416846.1 phosphatase PAP2 family protein [Microbacterium esteraromaticum]MBN8425473.1 phosphatase PAP2 family protein [Microbacterium esteraromaticum]WDH78289.1 phosphatase PAP2 family protein [Microbacterium esteraromaticum]